MSAKVESASEAAEESADTLAEESSHVHTEVCEHEWVPVYKTVYHDAEYDVIHHDAVYETVHHDAEYQTVHHDAVTETESHRVYHCQTCDATFETAEEMMAHTDEYRPYTFKEVYDDAGNLVKYIGYDKYGNEIPDLGDCHCEHSCPYVDTVIIIQEAYDEEVLVKDAWDEQVVVTEAWDEYVLKKDAWTEEVVDHYECSKCGEWE